MRLIAILLGTGLHWTLNVAKKVIEYFTNRDRHAHVDLVYFNQKLLSNLEENFYFLLHTIDLFDMLTDVRTDIYLGNVLLLIDTFSQMLVNSICSIVCIACSSIYVVCRLVHHCSSYLSSSSTSFFRTETDRQKTQRRYTVLFEAHISMWLLLYEYWFNRLSSYW
jgi:hypothetical protein